MPLVALYFGAGRDFRVSLSNLAHSVCAAPVAVAFAVSAAVVVVNVSVQVCMCACVCVQVFVLLWALEVHVKRVFAKKKKVRGS